MMSKRYNFSLWGLVAATLVCSKMLEQHQHGKTLTHEAVRYSQKKLRKTKKIFSCGEHENVFVELWPLML